LQDNLGNTVLDRFAKNSFTNEDALPPKI